ncbi:MAG: AMP-binding protein [Acidimicrobiales bacterium]
MSRWERWHEGLAHRPSVTGTIPDLLERAAAQWPDVPALSEPDGTTTSFAALAGQAAALGSALRDRGFGNGEPVAVMLPNGTPYVVSLFGILRTGAPVVQVNPIYTGPELEYMLDTTKATAIVVGADKLETVRGIRAATSLRLVIVAGSEVPLDDGEISLAALIDAGDPSAGCAPIDPDTDLATFQFTGGTTGRSKGAMLTHTNLLAGMQPTFDMVLADPDRLPPGSKAVAAAPFFHIFGLTMVLFAGLHHGWHLLLVPRPTPDGLVDLIRDQRPGYLGGVATLFTALVNHPEAATAGFDKLELYTSGGASVPEALLRNFEQLSGRTIFEGYGLSEGAPVSFNTHVRGSVSGSIGIPIPGTEVRIIDVETGDEAAPGQPGELRVRGPQIMQGYWAMPDETAAALVDGWLCTGDVATMDEQGYLRIVDRMKDMINAPGYKVYPRGRGSGLPAARRRRGRGHRGRRRVPRRDREARGGATRRQRTR